MSETKLPKELPVAKEECRLRKALPVLLPILLWVVLSAIPAPQGLTQTAWLYFALFAGVILGLVLEPIPGPVIGLLGITIASVLNLVAAKPADSLKWALSGFSNSTVWLIFA